MKQVFCIGEALIDFVAENQGGTLENANGFLKKAGGAPANVSAAIAKLGGQAQFVGAVGTDAFGSFLINKLKSLGVKTEYVLRVSDFTTLAFVSIETGGERDFVFNRGADAQLSYDTRLAASFFGEMVHFGSATALLEGTLKKTYSACLEAAITNKSFISFDPNYRSDLWKNKKAEFIKDCKPFLQAAHLVKLSLEEALLLGENENLKHARKHLHALGVSCLLVTLGDRGTMVSSFAKEKIVDTIAIKAVDTTGAGDAFTGCLLKLLSGCEDLFKVVNSFDSLLPLVAKANIAGALTATKYGAIAALPNASELEAAWA